MSVKRFAKEAYITAIAGALLTSPLFEDLAMTLTVFLFVATTMVVIYAVGSFFLKKLRKK